MLVLSYEYMSLEKEKQKALEPLAHVEAIKSTEAFRSTLSHVAFNKLDLDERRRVINRAITKSARFLAESATKDSGYRTPEGHRFALIAQLEPFYRAQKALNKIRQQEQEGVRVSFSKKRYYRNEVIEFNHTLKDVIDSHPSLSFNELLTFVTRMYQGANPNQNITDFTHEVRLAMNGMRHEIGATQIIGALGLEYDETDNEQEMKGQDLIVYINGQPVPIDIKASPATVEIARQKSLYPDHIIWSHIEDYEFDGGFRIPYELAQQKGPAMMRDLNQAARAEGVA